MDLVTEFCGTEHTKNHFFEGGAQSRQSLIYECFTTRISCTASTLATRREGAQFDPLEPMRCKGKNGVGLPKRSDLQDIETPANCLDAVHVQRLPKRSDLQDIETFS